MGRSIGIDLGTTNSVVCIMHTKPEIILNSENSRLTPSEVAFRRSKKTGDAIIVGKIAADYSRMAKKNFIYSIKRLMGRGYDDEEVQTILREGRVSYEIVSSPDGAEDVVRVRLGGKLYRPQEISMMVLKKLKDDAEQRLGDKVDSAIITVPAYFNERQRAATREAGLLAGLKVKKIIDEPSAAAIAYGIDMNDGSSRMVLVFDLGGGTFDVSILLIGGGVFSQMDIEGDMWLGGDDFDRLIVSHVLQQVEAEYEMEDLASNEDFMHVLRKKAREAKEILSAPSQKSAEIIITDVLKDEEGLPLEVDFEITRDEFEHLIRPQVDRAMELVKKALAGANLNKEDIDVVLLVGGSSTIPAFQQAIEGLFGKDKVLRNIDPMTCVAQGAGILAKSLSGVWCPECNTENDLENEKCEKCGADLGAAKEEPREEVQVYGRTPQPYGIEIEGNKFVEIIPKNSMYPSEEPHMEEFHTIVPDQRIIKIPVREGFSERASENKFMGNIWFRDLPPGLPARTVIDVSMALDRDMVFTLGCRIRGTDWVREVTLQHDGWENAALDEAMTTHIEIQNQGITSTDTDELEKHIRGIEKAVEDRDQKTAMEHMRELKRIREQGGSGGGGQVSWRTPLENIIFLGESNIAKVRPILNDNDPNLLAYEDWVRDAKAALATDDEARGTAIKQDGITKLLEVPLVGDLVMATMVAKDPKLNPSTSTRLEQAKLELFANIERNDTVEIKASLAAFRKILNAAMAEVDQAGVKPRDIGVMLDK